MIFDVYNGPLGALHWIQALITYELDLTSSDEAYGECKHHLTCICVCLCVYRCFFLFSLDFFLSAPLFF